ncbi:MAG: SHOCT domain-containing protein, partial [Hoeflea sp.]|nr:SHOCT domain-containing protein [Hoeflea sp.]
VAGQGTLAQFNHPDLGGMGQWSLGGMTMVGDLFNTQLKARVEAICVDVAQLLGESSTLRPRTAASQTQSQSGSPGDAASLFVSGGASGLSSGTWWPGEFGHAASTGAQNRMRYAWFPQARRLAIDRGDGAVRVYDTGDHRIGGFSQSQSGDQSLSFTSQHGLVRLSDLREVDSDAQEDGDAGARHPTLSEALQTLPSGGAADHNADGSSRRHSAPEESGTPEQPQPAAADYTEDADIFSKIERLAALHAKGILTDGEYQAKKAELLARI